MPNQHRENFIAVTSTEYTKLKIIATQRVYMVRSNFDFDRGNNNLWYYKPRISNVEVFHDVFYCLRGRVNETKKNITCFRSSTLAVSSFLAWSWCCATAMDGGTGCCCAPTTCSTGDCSAPTCATAAAVASSKHNIAHKAATIDVPTRLRDTNMLVNAITLYYMASTATVLIRSS